MEAHNHLLTPFAGHPTSSQMPHTHAGKILMCISLKRSTFIKFFKFHYVVVYLYFSADILKIQSRSGVRFRSHLCFNALVTLVCSALLSIQSCPCSFLQLTIEQPMRHRRLHTYIDRLVCVCTRTCVCLSVCQSFLSDN